MSKFGRELVSRGHEFVYVHSNLDALNKNDWSGLTVLQYQAPMTEPEWDKWTVQLSTIDPIGGVKIIFEVQESFCKALVADKAILDSLRGADAFIADSAFPCGTFIADLVGIPVRVDFSAVGVSGQCGIRAYLLLIMILTIDIRPNLHVPVWHTIDAFVHAADGQPSRLKHDFL